MTVNVVEAGMFTMRGRGSSSAHRGDVAKGGHSLPASRPTGECESRRTARVREVVLPEVDSFRPRVWALSLGLTSFFHPRGSAAEPGTLQLASAPQAKSHRLRNKARDQHTWLR